MKKNVAAVALMVVLGLAIVGETPSFAQFGRFMNLKDSVMPAVKTVKGTSTDDEVKMGDELDVKIRQQYHVVSEGAVAQKVSRIGDKVASASQSPYPMSYTVLDDPTVNAFATPGGHVYVYTGLLGKLKTDDQIAAVLGHETAHITQHHSINQMRKEQMSNLALSTGSALSGKNLDNQLTRALQFLLKQKFSRADEESADKFGIDYMTKAGYASKGMVDVLNMLAALQTTHPNPFTTSHPAPESRVKEAEAYIKSKSL